MESSKKKPHDILTQDSKWDELFHAPGRVRPKLAQLCLADTVLCTSSISVRFHFHGSFNTLKILKVN